MATITLQVPNELAEKLRSLNAATLTDVLQMGLAQCEAGWALDEHLQHMQTDNVVAASHRAKELSHVIIEDQGFAAVALLFTDFLAQAVQSTWEKRLFGEIAVGTS